MKQKSLFSAIFYPVVVMILATTLTFMWLTTHTIKKFYLQIVEEHLIEWAKIASILSEQIYQDQDRLDSLSSKLDNLTGIRITFIAPDGTVLSDSRKKANQMENHKHRPEVSTALKGEKGVAIHQSPTLGLKMMYLALPVKKDTDTPLLVIRTALPLTAINNTLTGLYHRLALLWVLIILGAALICYIITRILSRPVTQMQVIATELGAENFKARMPRVPIRELNALSQSLNQMADKLNSRIAQETKYRKELDAVLRSMNEGILAVDDKNRVLLINRAAERFLGIMSSGVINRPLPEVIRHPQVVEFFEKLIKNPNQEELLNYKIDWRGQILNLNGAHLLDDSGNYIGTLVVFSDVTRLHNLERVRQDFVANVSHELRTPITAIIGAAETLTEAIKVDPSGCGGLVDIIRRNSERMIGLIEDLLSLARLEQKDFAQNIPMEAVSLTAVAQNALNLCADKLKAKDIKGIITGEARISRGNPSLLEQAIVNLLDNAIKNSPIGSQVNIILKEDSQEASILIEDHGCGIESQHLPRLFERFYRVDVSRSRQEGGTGLGLAIVKHIALLHKGRVSVTSTPAVGSTFGIHLPV